MKEPVRTVYRYICDLCGDSSDHWRDYWAHNFNGGVVTICEDGFNGRDLWSWEHLCPRCRVEIEKAVGVVVKARGALKTGRGAPES